MLPDDVEISGEENAHEEEPARELRRGRLEKFHCILVKELNVKQPPEASTKFDG